MKKVIAVLLTAVLIVSAVVALAAEGDTTVTMSEARNFKVDTTTAPATKAEQQTALWVRVKAEGQIDCSIPLVLIYDTNINGGEATTDGTYKIINNSSSDLVVTSIEFDTNGKNDKLTLVEKPSSGWASADVDKYWGTIVADNKLTTAWNFSSGTKSQTAANGGVFLIPAKKNTKHDAVITVSVGFSPLSFVTDASKAKGIHMVDIKYTVAIDTQNAVGIDIKNPTAEPVVGTYYNTGKVYGDNVEFNYTADSTSGKPTVAPASPTPKATN